jgi:hypothetical protein
MMKLALLLIAFRCLIAQTSPCDLNGDGVVNQIDVQLAVNQALGISRCTVDLDHTGVCTIVDVQRVINAAAGGSCLVTGGSTGIGNGIGTNTPVTDNLAIYETDGVNRTNFPVTFGRAFKQGEFTQCLQPVAGGSPISNYQVDVKNRWPDGSVKFADVSLIVSSLPALGAASVTFQPASSCNNSGYLSQSQMVNFNSGSWGAQIRVTAAGTTVTRDASTMLSYTDPGSNSFGDCKNDYWLQGPVVTAVIVQDCTTATAYDFGWVWNGSTMSSPTTGNCGGTPACASSLHPWFILYFYPGSNAVRADMILENDWTDRQQNQAINVDYYTCAKGCGSGAAKVLGYDGVPRILPASSLTLTANSDAVTCSSGCNFTSADVGSSIAVGANGVPSVGSTSVDTTICAVTDSVHITLCGPPASGVSGGQGAINIWYWGQRYRKTFWTGTGNPGNYLIDHNWSYMVSTQMVPPYDTSVSGSPDSQALAVSDDCNASPSTGTDFKCMAMYSVTGSGFGPQTWSDMGDRGGHGRLDEQFTQADGDPAPITREVLEYLTNMGTCGTANGKCAKAWLDASGLYGARDASLITGSGVASPASFPAFVGGSGIFNNAGNIPYHNRESRTTSPAAGSGGHYFCPNMAAGQYANTGTGTGNDVVYNPFSNSSSCGTSSDTPFGRPISRYFDITAYGGTSNASGSWGVPTGAQVPNTYQGHWGWDSLRGLQYNYEAYLITGDYYYALSTQEWGAAQLIRTNYGITESSYSFAVINSGSAMRATAAALTALQEAWAASPDGTVEQEYFDSMSASSAEVYEGMMGLVNGVGGVTSSLTPSTSQCGFSNSTCTTFTANPNRWDLGRYSIVSLCGTGGYQPGNNCVPVVPALHNWGWTESHSAGLSSNADWSQMTIEYAIPGSTTQVIDWNTGSQIPAVGTSLYIAGALSPWTALNGTHTISAATTTTSNCPIGTCHIYTIDANTTGNSAGATTGSILGSWNWAGQITGATIGTHTTLSSNTNVGIYWNQIVISGCVDQGGTNWSGLNGFWYTRPVVSTTTFHITNATYPSGFDTTGFPPFSQSGCVWTEFGFTPNGSIEDVQGWMEGLLGIAVNGMKAKGIPYYNNVITQVNLRQIEKILDPNTNPYLIGLNFQPLKPYGSFPMVPSNNTALGKTPNQFFTSWTGVVGALGAACMTVNSFWSSNSLQTSAIPGGANCNQGGNPCTDHSYSLINRALAAFLPGLVDTADGNLSGTAAWNWIKANFPYFSYSPPGTGTLPNGNPGNPGRDKSCSSIYTTVPDSQIKFAFAPL